jgi:pimeloyl-ACP methyl ester carboxylesterase
MRGHGGVIVLSMPGDAVLGSRRTHVLLPPVYPNGYDVSSRIALKGDMSGAPVGWIHPWDGIHKAFHAFFCKRLRDYETKKGAMHLLDQESGAQRLLRTQVVHRSTVAAATAAADGEVVTELPSTPGVAAVAIHREEVSVLGYRMRYLVAGTGEPVLLLHGLADTGDSWIRILPGLARRYQVFAPDLMGCGASEKPRINYSLWALAVYTRHFLDAVGVERADIVGHSLGAGLALHLFFQYPERVKRLALLAAGGMGRDLPLSLRLCTLTGSSAVIGALLASRHSSHPFARAGRLVLSHLWPATRVADQSSAAVDDRSRAERQAAVEVFTCDAELRDLGVEEDGILERLRDPMARAAFLAMLRSVGDIRGQHVTALSQLHLVTAPVLLIHGRNDMTIPVSHGQAAESQFADARLEVLEDCGHCPHREAPAAVLDLLERFLGGDGSLANPRSLKIQ